MNEIPGDDPRIPPLVEAIEKGQLETIKSMLDEHPGLAGARIRHSDGSGTFLHAATNWPGHFPNIGETITLLIQHGAVVNARLEGEIIETPLHFAASSNDLVAIDSLIDGGADLEMDGAVTDGGTALSDAVNFENWEAAHHLVKRGAKTNLGESAALGLIDRVQNRFDDAEPPKQGGIDWAFWMACSTNQREIAEFLIEKNANVNWVPDWDKRTSWDVASQGGFAELADWIRSHGGTSVAESEQSADD